MLNKALMPTHRPFRRATLVILLLSSLLHAEPGSDKADSAEALFISGKRHYLGEGVPKDPAKALVLIREAAEEGLPEAQGWYGFLLASGSGTSRDETAGLLWIRKAAAAGVPSAQFNLGQMLMKGSGAERDPAAAADWITRAAEGGQVEAQAKLAEHFYFGTDAVEKDVAKALPWAKRAAEAGHAWSQNLYGNLLEWGETVPINRTLAMDWYRRSAEQGNAKAQASLGRLYASGLVGKRDVVEAYYWLWKGAEQEEWNAINFLKDMVPGMTEAERKEALKRVGMEGNPE